MVTLEEFAFDSQLSLLKIKNYIQYLYYYYYYYLFKRWYRRLPDRQATNGKKHLNKYVKAVEKDGTISYGIVDYWIEEMGEVPFILINHKSIDIKDKKIIAEVTEQVAFIITRYLIFICKKRCDRTGNSARPHQM